MIKNFKNDETEKIWKGMRSKKLPPEIQDIARRKLRMLNNAHNLLDLSLPPANKLEKLKGDRKNQHGIRVNNQWRICFVWKNNDVFDVEIEDYH